MAELTPEEVQQEKAAMVYIKGNTKSLVDEFCGSCIPVAKPITLFMAGSPGAGKTEVSKGLMRKFPASMPVRIDADAIRAWCPGYAGANAHVFQRAASKGVNILYDQALRSGLHVILDGTFAYKAWAENIDRSLRRDRLVEIWFVYQNPLIAWEFTQAREVMESRRVSKEVFIRGYIMARQNVIEAKNKYGRNVTLNLLVKDIENGDEQTHLNIQSVDLDRFMGKMYSEDELNELLK